MCGHIIKCLVRISDRYLHYLRKKNYSFEKRPMLYNGIFGCNENICNVILINGLFCKVHSTGPINVCANFEINRYKINLENLQKSYVLFELYTYKIIIRCNLTLT